VNLRPADRRQAERAGQTGDARAAGQSRAV